MVMSWRLAASVVVCVAMTAATVKGCVESTSQRTGPEAGFDLDALLVSLGENVVLATYRDFVVAADALAAATATHARTLSSEDLNAARQAWRDAMVVWQRAEVMQLGPAGKAADTIGGEDLRDQIYSWPLVNPCRVDQELVEGVYHDSVAFSAELHNVRGLDALEYLLFHDDDDNSCAPQNDINQLGSWDAVSDLPQRRADYAATAAALLAQEAVVLRDRWEPSEGNFLGELVANGPFESPQQALNAASDAMFYLETATKDVKLAVPAGVFGCAQDVCPDALESKYAAASKQHIVANIEGFQHLFVGGSATNPDAIGFDDLLVGLGRADLAQEMVDAIDVSLAVADSIEEDQLRDALSSDPDSVRALYLATQALVDLARTEWMTVLQLQLPKAVEGDND